MRRNTPSPLEYDRRPLAAVLLAHSLCDDLFLVGVAEILTLDDAFGVSFGFASPHAVGEYQGVWILGSGAVTAIGPGLLTLVCLRGGSVGWVALPAAMIACTGLMSSAIKARLTSPARPAAVWLAAA